MVNGSIASVLVMRVSLISTVLVDCTGVPLRYHIIDVSCSELLNILPDTLSVPLHDNVTVLSSSTISLGLDVMIISPISVTIIINTYLTHVYLITFNYCDRL